MFTHTPNNSRAMLALFLLGALPAGLHFSQELAQDLSDAGYIRSPLRAARYWAVAWTIWLLGVARLVLVVLGAQPRISWIAIGVLLVLAWLRGTRLKSESYVVGQLGESILAFMSWCGRRAEAVLDRHRWLWACVMPAGTVIQAVVVNGLSSKSSASSVAIYNAVDLPIWIVFSVASVAFFAYDRFVSQGRRFS
jgi:hypothetical protein